MKISVIVPVFNPGPHIDRLIDSLARQTMPSEDFEAVFVDDGSTDDTPARLDRLAAERTNVSVIHQENSGWPGKPRNVGLEASSGEYVFFSDHDDWFGIEALERLYAMARRVDADIVIGKMVGHNRGVPGELFRRTVDRATLADTPLIDSLTPHKLFRKRFLDDHSLRFPEGKRRLEDHVFVVAAYFAAQTIAVLADYPCYHHISREDASNAGFTRIDPPSYYGYVRETLAIVEGHTEPGALRDRLLRRFLRQEMLGRLSGKQFLRQDAEYQRVLHGEVRRLIQERIPTTVDDGLPGQQRLLAAVVRHGDLDDVIELTTWSVGVRLDVELRRVRWRAGALDLEVQGRLHADGGPLVRRRGDRLVLACPAAGKAGAILPDVTVDLKRARAQVVVKLRNDGTDVRTSGTQRVDVLPDGSLAVSLSTALDPQTAAAGAPLKAGVWDISARVAALGWALQRRVPADGSVAAYGGLAAVLGGTPRLAVGYATVPHQNLSLDLLGRGRVPNEALARPAGRPRCERAGGAAVLTVPVRLWAEREGPVVLVLRRRDAAGTAQLAARLCPVDDDLAEVKAGISAAEARMLTHGVWQANVRLPAGPAGGIPLGVEVSLAGPRRVMVARSGPGGPSASRRIVVWLFHGEQSLRRQVGRARRRLRRRISALRR